MSRCCEASRMPLIIPILGWTRRWWIACWKCAISLPKGWGARRDPRRCCTICPVTRACSRLDCVYRSLRAPSTGCCESTDALPFVCPICPIPLSVPSRCEPRQLDFKDASSVPADPDGKQQHVVETLNILDKGTSVLIASYVRPDFTAETALQALAHTFATHGLPQ